MLVNIALVFSGFFGGLGAAVAFLTPIGRRLSRIDHGITTIWNVVLGAPAKDGRPAVPGVIDRFTAQDETISRLVTGLSEVAARIGMPDVAEHIKGEGGEVG